MSQQILSGEAISYLRFSSRKQERGQSVIRQTEARDAWLARNPGVKLVDHFADLAKSGFRGRHRLDDTAALKQLIRKVDSREIKPGTYLITESFDRLTREEYGEAAEFVFGLINRGIRIVQLSPVEVILEKPVDLTKSLLLVVELSRGHGESARKSEMVGKAYAKKREWARKDGHKVTGRCKAWLSPIYSAGKKLTRYEFKDGARALIQRIFGLATNGHGARAIAAKLNKEGVAPWVKGSQWHEFFVRQLLRGREALGEYQPCIRQPDGTRKPDGEPIADYYPAAVTEGEWKAARDAMHGRDKRGGRPTIRAEHVNVFAGMVFDARTAEPLNVVSRQGHRVFMPSGYKRRGSPGVSFPVAAFEDAVFAQLEEVEPGAILARDSGPDEVTELTAKLARLDAQRKRLIDAIELTDDPDASERLKQRNGERQTLVETLDKAKSKAANPLSAKWGEAVGLVQALKGAADQREARLRLRQALGGIVESVYCLFWRVGLVQFAIVQIAFAGARDGTERILNVRYRQAHGPSRTGAELMVRSGVVECDRKSDLRDRKNAADTLAVFSKLVAVA